MLEPLVLLLLSWLLLAAAARRIRAARLVYESKARLVDSGLRRAEERLARAEDAEAPALLLDARAALTAAVSSARLGDPERLALAFQLCERLLLGALEAARRPQPRLEPADAAVVLDSAAALREGEARLKNVEFVRRYADGAQPVLMDVRAMERVFLHLVSNALDSAPSGSALRLSTELSRAPDGTPLSVRAIVEDSGPGVPPDPPGLPECRRAVLLWGGSLWAEGSPEGGARFVVEIPQGRALPSAVRAAAPSRPSSHLSR